MLCTYKSMELIQCGGRSNLDHNENAKKNSAGPPKKSHGIHNAGRLTAQDQTFIVHCYTDKNRYIVSGRSGNRIIMV
jgi:hypothetical protein